MDPKDFLNKQGYAITTHDATSLRCMDDRYSNKDMPLADYAVPGGGLGIIADIVSGFEAVAGSLTKEQIQIICDEARQHVGAPSFHTGENHNKSISSPVEGCGYLAASLEGYAYLSKQSADFLKSWATEIVAEGYRPVCFHGTHAASFVLLVPGYGIGIVPTADDGTQAYVIHVDVRTDLLNNIADAAYENMKNTLAIAKEAVIDAVNAAAARRLNEVVQQLGADTLPRYMVTHNNGQWQATPTSQAQPEPTQNSIAA